MERIKGNINGLIAGITKNGRQILWLIGLMALLCMVFQQKNTVHAESAKAQKLEAGREYTCDLDGDGEPETVRWKYEGTKAAIFVNGKRQVRVTVIDSMCGVYLCDLDRNDKKKEICLESETDSFHTVKSYAYRYSDGKLKKYYAIDWGKYWDNNGWGMQGRLFGSDSIEYGLDLQPGNGDVRFVCSGSDDSLGSFMFYRNFKVSKGSLRPKDKKTFRIANHWKEMPYFADEKLTVKTGRNSGATAFTLKKGDRFHILKIYAQKEDMNRFQISYIYVKNADGKKGWLKVPAHAFYNAEYGGKYVMG